jgi:hypothetical protein
VWVDNLTPPGAPKVERERVEVPLTPWAVRSQVVEAAAEIPEAKRPAYVRRRATPLDRLVNDDEASALEAYATAEQEFTRAKTTTYDAIRVDGGGVRDPDRIAPRLALLRRHALVKKRLAPVEVEILQVFAAQMQGDTSAPDYDDAARRFRLAVRAEEQPSSAWFRTLARLARLLVQLHKADAELARLTR